MKTMKWTDKEKTGLVLSVLAGEQTAEQAACEHGLSVSKVESWISFYLYAARQGARGGKSSLLSGLGRLASRRTAKIAAVTFSVCLMALVSVVVFSQSMTCDDHGGLIACFTAGAPAKASEVDNNFAQIIAWLENKVGAVENADVRIQGGTTSNEATAAGKPLFVSGGIGYDSDGIEFRHDNLSQGIGFGFNTIYATGTYADQDLNLKARGTGSVIVKGKLAVQDGEKVIPVKKTAVGGAELYPATCGTTAANACPIDISSGGFTFQPACVITMVNPDGTGYVENAVISQITATQLYVWRGNFANAYNAGVTMLLNWMCYGY